MRRIEPPRLSPRAQAFETLAALCIIALAAVTTVKIVLWMAETGLQGALP